MDKMKESVGLPSELTVEVLIRGALSLEQGESERVFQLLKKGLENLIAQKKISNRVAKQFKQLKQKEEKMKKIKIVLSEVTNRVWEHNRSISNSARNEEIRKWCYDGMHIKARVLIRDQGISGAPHIYRAFCVKEGEVEISSCDCVGQLPIMEVEVDKLPLGFIPDKIAQKLGLCRQLTEKEVFVYVSPVNSSNWAHSRDVVCCKEGDLVSPDELSIGKFLKDGQMVIVKASIHIGGGEYKQGLVTVTNKGGVPVAEENAGTVMVCDLNDCEHTRPFVPKEYNPKRDGKPVYGEFCPRHRWSEWEEYARALNAYIKITGDVEAGLEAVRTRGWTKDDSLGELYWDIIFAGISID